MKRLLLLLVALVIVASCDTPKKRIEKARKAALSYIIHGCIEEKYFYGQGALCNSLDSVFYFPTFSGAQKKEYAEYERRLSIAHMYERSILWQDKMKEKYDYADSARIFTHKLDSMAALSSREPWFMGYAMSDKFFAVRMNDPEDTIRAIITLYFPPKITHATMDRKDLIFYAKPIDKN